MKKLLTAAAAGAMLLGGAGLAHAQGPDPSGPAKYGLCTAYSHNSQQAKDHGQAFQNLEAAAQANGGETVAQFCNGATPGGK